MILELPECSKKSKARTDPISSENMHDNWKPKVIKYVTKVLNLSRMVVISICLALLWRDSDLAGLRGLLKTLKWEQSLREKCPNTEYFLVRISPHWDWIRRDTECLSAFSPKTRKCGPKKTPYLDTFHAVSFESKIDFWFEAYLVYLIHIPIFMDYYFLLFLYSQHEHHHSKLLWFLHIFLQKARIWKRFYFNFEALNWR